MMMMMMKLITRHLCDGDDGDEDDDGDDEVGVRELVHLEMMMMMMMMMVMMMMMMMIIFTRSSSLSQNRHLIFVVKWAWGRHFVGVIFYPSRTI